MSGTKTASKRMLPKILPEFVSISGGPEPEVKTEVEEEEPSAKRVNLLSSAVSNNNEKKKLQESCFVHIKEEPPDNLPDHVISTNAFVTPVVTSVTPVKTVEVVADEQNGGVITIKTEPRVLEEEEDVNIDDDIAEKSDEEDELDFEDDENDVDFELDSSDTSISGGNKSRNSYVSSAASHASADDVIKETNDDDEDDNQETGSFDFNGMKIETVGNYSKCPKCKKNIKSTFIIRHLKLHDAPDEKFQCPEKGCNLQVNRINNLFRHLREIHKSKKPYVCKRSECGARFAKAQQLKQHSGTHR